MKKILIILIFFVSNQVYRAQNVGINITGAAPVASAMLDIVSNSSGLLIPRVALTALNVSGPVTAPATSLLVYNTAVASSGSTAVYPGFYFWDGAKWVAFGGNGGKDWSLTGNAGTIVGTNFLGTTDAVALALNTNAIERMRIMATGVVGIGTTAPSTSGVGVVSVDKFNITSSTNVAGGDMVEISNTGANGLNTYVINSNTANSYNALAGETRYNGFTYTPSGVYGFANATSGYANGVSGITSSNVGFGVYAQAPLANSAGVYGLYVYGRVLTTGNYYTTSDARLKKNIVPVSNALAKVLKLQAVEYDFDEKYKDFVESDERQTGFLAQDVEKVIPNVVSSASLISKASNVGSNQSEERKRMDAKVVAYSGIVPYLVEAIKEQQQQIEVLKAEIAKLKKDK